MTNLLYRLGTWSARNRRAMLAVWVLLLAVLGGLAGALSGPTSSSLLIPGTESQQALDLLAGKFLGTGGASARIVVAAPPSHKVTDTAYTAAAKASLAQIAKAPRSSGSRRTTGRP
ncbi:hypothetical protein [Frankia sp. R82]|uniref:hypothetical protein n=1 Tax=Frankia sp. R82 TaxID=2950553 RepID=UPI002043DB55|nr:hypothetical protein [Frankia sp. R82]MCM3885574.1 hypothetical protein [Frankia sp. R82]